MNSKNYEEGGEVGKCPFCGFTVWYTPMDRDTRTADTIQCNGDCGFLIQTDYDEGKGKALEFWGNYYAL